MTDLAVHPAPPETALPSSAESAPASPSPVRVDPGDGPETTPGPEPLWREVVGELLRDARGERGETLAETSRRAGVSPQYLSEMERGLKEPSSEMIAAVAGALGLSLLDLTLGVAGRVAPSAAPVAAPIARPVRSRAAFALAA